MKIFNKLDKSVDASGKNIFMTTNTKLFKQNLYISNYAIKKHLILLMKWPQSFIGSNEQVELMKENLMKYL